MLSATENENFQDAPWRGASYGELLSAAPPPPPSEPERVGLPPPEWEPAPPPLREAPGTSTPALDAAKLGEGQEYNPGPPPIFTEDPPPVPQEPFVVEKADWRQEEVAAARRDRLAAEQAERAAELAALARLQAQLREEQP